MQPGDEIHFVALLDEQGETLETVPMRQPLALAPRRPGAHLTVTGVDVTVRAEETLRGTAE